ncbi:Bug family tripartite tricarboxylate transporter substrate binding protein [Pollutimonas harenae]|uniref:Tripartite tricarboxylate transporter substrate binding protein n=1 Tax=Pollutimonas harenae TaxID=657015 RepID=A0A853H1I2_9BURK|nr:tripartite tricarboxylate transporter substrate binding protein [Pollutimonas harenae]NYT84433.1 tripartite tricarboxylate transporter substrate binding protein [Pollutimonas harenae]TEA73166.1 tripartite tricarboxylate transporter substrate binding protein [Pollutimonas harenae]
MRIYKLSLAVAAFCTSIAAQAANYPSKPVDIVVPFTPGGVTDAMTRNLADKLQEKLGQPVVVVNKPGAGTVIASNYVARTKPDGYTLLMAASSLGIAPHLYKSTVTYDVKKDFSPIALVAVVPHLLVVDSKIPAKSVGELIAYLGKNPDRATYASSGNGTSNHLEGELFASLSSLEMTHVPYKGSAPGLTSLASGDVTMMFVDVAAAKPFLESGKVRALAVTTPQRSKQMPDLPTVSESGLQKFDAMPWLGIVAAAGTPKEIVIQLNDALKEIGADSTLAAQFSTMGLDPVFNLPDEFASFIQEENDKWATVIKQAKIVVE